MKGARQIQTLTYRQCKHAHLLEPDGLALITIGSSFRGDEGIAHTLCDVLPKRVLKGVCRFDLGSHAGFMADCLYNHKAAIIIDSTVNGADPGTVSILDLGTIIARATPMIIPSSHGLSVAEELRAAKKSNRLPERLIFVGVEENKISASEGLSRALKRKLPELVDNLSILVTKVLETLQRDA